MPQKGFQKEFYWYGQLYRVHVIPFHELSAEEVKHHAAKEGNFLIHLFDGSSYKSFLLFYDEGLEWNSNVSRIILDDRDLFEKIGFLIDNTYS